MNGALPRPQYAEEELLLPGVLLFQSRDDATAKGEKLAEFNPALPNKLWTDRRAGLPAYVSYTIIVLDASQNPVTQEVSFPRAYAQSLNISIGQPGAPTSPDTDPFPIRPLFDDEELAIQFGGGIVVHNKLLWDALTSGGGAGFGSDDRKLLQAVAADVAAVKQKIGA
jgi:hypothetical protein